MAIININKTYFHTFLFRKLLKTSATQLNNIHAFNKSEEQSNAEEEESYDYSASNKLYSSHIPTTAFQKFLLGVGSGAMALYRPQRDDMVAIMGETTGQLALPKIRDKMYRDPEGQEILRDRPRINSSTVDLSYLRSLPVDTFGHEYVKFLDDNKVTPDSRLPVQFVDDEELAYVMQRYREVHDLVHSLLGMPTNMLGEVAVKWIEALQTGLPMCILGSLFGPIRFYPKQRQKYASTVLPWAIRTGFKSKFLMNVYFEKRWTQTTKSLREELNIEPPPDISLKTKKK